MSAMAVTGFVLALVALILSWIPIINNVSGFALAPLAVIFSIIGIVRARGGRFRGRGLAIAGLIIGVLSFVIVLVTQNAYSNAFDDAFSAGVEEGSAAGTAEDPLPFGQPVAFKSGLEVTVSQPVDFTPSESAFVDDAGAAAYKLEVTVTNVSDEDKSLLGTVDGWTVDGAQCEQVFDSAQLTGSIDGSLPVGKTVSAEIAFACPDTSALQIHMTPDLFTDKVWFAGG
jgi:hypothetical protein